MFQSLLVISYWSAISIITLIHRITSQTDLLTSYSHLIWFSTLIQKLTGEFNGHTLDLVITRCDENLLSNLEILHPLLSDHLLIHCHLNFTKHVTKPKFRAFRKLRSLDIDKFCSDLRNSKLLTSTPIDDLGVLVDCYNSNLHTLIDLHAHIVCKPVTLRSRAPWLTKEIRSAKTGQKMAYHQE